MGLASSQARLLSLTSRQHTIEANAQRLLSEKMRLSNDSDAAYQKYMDVLEDTTLKTRQINDLGETSWIDGSILNLMRYNSPENTDGSVFFVQDLDSGKLYVPQDVLDKYNDLASAMVPAGHTYTDDMKFATLFGTEYRKVDINEDIKIKYDNAIRSGWDTALTDAQYDAYARELPKDAEIQTCAKTLLGMIPDKDGGIYKINDNKLAIASNFETYALKLINNPLLADAYPAKDIKLLQEAMNIIKRIDPQIPQPYMDSQTHTNPTDPSETVEKDFQVTFETKKLSATKPGGTSPYINMEDGSTTFTEDQKFALMLNGGSTTWEGLRKFEYVIFGRTFKNETAESKTVDVYNSDTNAILAQHGATNMGDALRTVLNKMATNTPYSTNLLQTWGKTNDDVVTYRKFQEIKSDYERYQPEYEYVPSVKQTATYYQNLYKAITAAGGAIGVSDEHAKNSSWVENMIKNAKVILTTWDNNEMTLSRTSPSLHVDVKEISDDRRVAQAESDYEAESTFINEKDTKIDNILNKLETERTTITTEIQGIEKIMQDNVSNNFKVFS